VKGNVRGCFRLTLVCFNRHSIKSESRNPELLPLNIELLHNSLTVDLIRPERSCDYTNPQVTISL